MAAAPILMPKLGLTMTEGMLAEWKVAPGDRVAAGDVLFVVETDKISNEIEAPAPGTIGALHAAQGETLPVGAVLASWADAADPSPPGQVAADQSDGSRSPAGAAAQGDGPVAGSPARAGEDRPRVYATPLARRNAARAGIALAGIAGSGPRGRVTAHDVAAAGARTAGATIAAQDEPAPEPQPGAPARFPLGAYQRVTARRLTEAKRDIPHFYVQADADVTALIELRAQLNGEGNGGGGGAVKLTVSHFLLAAIARALVAMPEVNRVWGEDYLLALPTIDVGLAVEAPKGLVAPVLRDIGGASLDEVARAADALVVRARAGRQTPGDLAGGAIALSNVGMFGVRALVPIVNPGQSSILGVGAAQAMFRPDAAGAPVLRRMLTLSLSCDHRVIDGALAARFLQTLVRRLEAPAALLRRPAPEPAS